MYHRPSDFYEGKEEDREDWDGGSGVQLQHQHIRACLVAVQVALFDSLDVFWTRPARCLKHFGARPWREARIALFWRARTG